MKVIFLALFLVSCVSTAGSGKVYTTFCGPTKGCTSQMFNTCGATGYKVVSEEALTLGSKKDPLTLVEYTCH